VLLDDPLLKSKWTKSVELIKFIISKILSACNCCLSILRRGVHEKFGSIILISSGVHYQTSNCICFPETSDMNAFTGREIVNPESVCNLSRVLDLKIATR
jgi:hypothetical protein